MLTAVAASSSSIELCAKISITNTAKEATALGLAQLITGPCIFARSLKNLSFAKALQNELKNSEVVAPSFEKMAIALKRRGRVGLALGTILSLPIPFVMAQAHQQDEMQKKDSLENPKNDQLSKP